MKVTILLSVWLVSFSLSAQDKDSENFKLVKQDGDIFIYERWTTFPNTNPAVKAREVKGEFIFRANLYEGLRLIQDEKQIYKWQSHVSEFKVYKQQRDTTTWHEYSYHDIPWPVSDQDHFLEYKLASLSPSDLFISFATKVDDTRAPVRDGVTRMKLAGSWQLTQLSNERIKAVYRIYSMPIGIPKFVTDPIIRNNMMTTIKEYIGILEGKSR